MPLHTITGGWLGFSQCAPIVGGHALYLPPAVDIKACRRAVRLASGLSRASCSVAAAACFCFLPTMSMLVVHRFLFLPLTLPFRPVMTPRYIFSAYAPFARLADSHLHG
jgi:hypothetical protein